MRLHPVDESGIAARIRGLLNATNGDDYAFTARRLGVSEVALRMSADDVDPHPTFEVLAALIRVYGVDPGWLVTGHYNAQSHRATLDTSDEHRVSNVLAHLLAADARGEGLGSSDRLEA